MQCLTCQHVNEANARFCASCGSQLSRVCSACGNACAPGARFCASCGLNLEQSLTNDPSDRLNALTSQAAVVGERKLVTVLFADIVDSTHLIEDLEPDEAATQLQAIIEAMRDAVRRFGGTVNKIQGDGVMALFGAPIPQEDHAVRAACAALNLRETIGQLAGIPAKVRVGIHTGEAVIRAISNDLSEQYEAMGVAVHVAARLQQVAEPSTILLSTATISATRGAVDFQPLGRRNLKGLSQPFEIFALRAIRPAAASSQFRGQRLSDFVGRSRELKQLSRALHGEVAKTSRIVEIEADAGAGKSRLVFEFLEASRDLGIPIIECRATAHGQIAPLQPVLELLRSFFGTWADTPQQTVADKVRDRLASLDLSRHAPLLLHFLGAGSEANEAVPSDVYLRRALLLEVVQDITRAANQGPNIIVIDDIHWLDEASKPFVTAISRGLANTKALLVTTKRLGFPSLFDRAADVEHIELPALDTASIEAIVEDTIDGQLINGETRKQIAERAGGNPFFAEELVRAMTDQNDIGRRSEKRRGNGRLFAVPGTVRDVIGYRIDRLSERQKAFLQAASVLEKDFSAQTVASVAGLNHEEAQDLARDLQHAEMLHGKDDMAGGLAFKHPLVHEVAYASLVADRRKSLHRRAAAALAEQFSASVDEHSAKIAHHWSEGGDHMQAASAYLRAAQWMGPRDPGQALETWHKVRGSLQSVTETPLSQFMNMMACGQLINLAWRQGVAIEQIEPIYDEAIGIARALSDARSATLITIAYGRALHATRSADEYVARVQEAQSLLEASPNPSAEALSIAALSHALGISGYLRRALSLNERALQVEVRIDAADRQLLGFNPKYWLWALRARYLALSGRSDEVDVYLAKLLSENEQVDTFHRAMGLAVQMELAAIGRNTERVGQILERMNDLLAGDLSPYLFVILHHYRGIALLAMGQPDDANVALTKGLDYSRTSRAGLEQEPFMLANLGESLARRQPDLALQYAKQARSLAKIRSMRVAEAYAISSQIRIAHLAGLEHDSDQAAFRALVEETGAEFLKQRIA